MAAVRYEIAFTGRVQGVGFRATTLAVARNFNVAGWVRNEPDGSVTCVAEGEVPELDAFVKRVESEMSGYLRDTSIHRTSATGEFDGFNVRY